MNRSYIGGDWVEGKSVLKNLNPSDINDCVGEFECIDQSQTNEAIQVASDATTDWQEIGIHRRAEILDSIGSKILERKDELGTLLSREEGKTLPEGLGEVERAGHIFKFFAGEAVRISGSSMDSVRYGVDVEISREPLGLVGIITPWNFPIAIPAWKIAPALAYGNTVVFKPAGLVPASAHALTEIISESGLPSGVFNLVMGSGSEVGAAIVESPLISAVTFTGSVETGRDVLVKTAERQAKVQLEMGGKNPLVILDDADLDIAVECALNGAFYSTGQRCTASSRLIVTSGIHDHFVTRLVERMEKMKVDHALEPGTEMGPVVDETQLKQDLEYLEIGRSEGAEIVSGGIQLERKTKGYYLAPTLFTETSNNMRINQEEIFGPIATVLKVKDYEEALSAANDTSFGLSAGICTNSLKYSRHFRHKSEAGMVMVNLPTAGVDYHVPFGGRRNSSFGPREQGQAAAQFYTATKTAYISS
ncbi:MAG: aldehyde dehydrogenase family protein [Rhodospirillaceae bacterium]|nr:aldehyde dehydrogenase family protein [Rhodospirillaceae bacterium]